MAEFTFAPSKVLVPSFAGYGAQYNQNVFADISRAEGVTDQNLPNMKSKLKKLKPQLVRIFFNRVALPHSDKGKDFMQSFQRTVDLAQETASTINITWQGGGVEHPDKSMGRFAEILAGLVDRDVTKLKWVTIQNEPNSTKITKLQYERFYRRLDDHLTTLGVRNKIHFMGGDLVGTTSPLHESQEDWLKFIANNMGDIVDAVSCHIYFKFDELAKLQRRLHEVHDIQHRIPEGKRKPLYVTEYGVRGDRKLPSGKLRPAPGTFQGKPLVETKINAFQHAWFAVLAATLGYHGVVKWDAYFGKYDTGKQAYGMIGHPRDGWPVRPSYELLRLLTQTVKPGSKVVEVDGSSGSKLLAGFLAPGGEITIVGLDTDGAGLNSTSPTQISYEIDGLPKNTSFKRFYWNRDGQGKTRPAGSVRTDAQKTLRVKAPLHSVFAVTTLEED